MVAVILGLVPYLENGLALPNQRLAVAARCDRRRDAEAD
jgi:hypothetical protein